jgi:hypothetical protein
MEAHLSRNCVNATFRNIRFVYNAVAPGNRRHYDLVAALGNQSVPHASSVTAGKSAFYGIAQFGGFDGPFVALFPAAIHSPRRDDIYDRERGEIQLR